MSAISAPESQRIALIDIIRGFALFGILLVNTPSLNTPVHLDTDDFGFQTSFLDHLVTKFIFTFAMESFYPIFAMLFGVGAAIFLSKKGPGIAGLYLRRMVILLCFGLLHASLVWWGDILIVYAVLGVPLVFFADKSAKAILNSVFVIMLIIFGISIFHTFTQSAETDAHALDATAIYALGNFADISAQRIKDYLQAFFLNDDPLSVFSYFLDMLGIMLLGMWIHKKGFLSRPLEHKNTIVKIATISGLFAFTLIMLNDVAHVDTNLLSPIKGLSKAIFYFSIIGLLMMSRTKSRLGKAFAAMGRMSLTSYLGFNIVLSLIFYGYGLGLYGSVGPAWQMPIVVGLYVAFIFFTSTWQKYFAYGPIEWLWRFGTYGRAPQFRKKRFDVASSTKSVDANF